MRFENIISFKKTKQGKWRIEQYSGRDTDGKMLILRITRNTKRECELAILEHHLEDERLQSEVR